MDPNYNIYYDERLSSILDELEDLKIELSKEEEDALNEISKLKSNIKEHDLLKDFGNAAMQGVQDYLNSFIDTSDIVNDLKNPNAIRSKDEDIVKFKNPPADPATPNPERTILQARESPYAANAKRDNSTMSEKGQRKLAYYEEVYKQRTKTISNHKNNLHGNLSDNEIALTGIESYQFGPKVSLYSADEYKTMFQEAGKPTNTANFIRSKNFQKYYNETYKEFGFESPSSFKEWVKENKFTIHEAPEGMYLVPTDVHASETHTGEVSKIHAYLRDEISKEELAKFEKESRIAKVKYETATRVTRTGKAVAMGSATIIVKEIASIIVNQTYFEFSRKSDDDFTLRLKRVADNCVSKFKTNVKPTIQKLANGAVGNVATEVLTALNDFVFKTAKNIIKVIRAMIGSIIRALKVLTGNEYTWEEKVFEALKILSAGLVAALGFSLNEVIKDLITGTGVAPLVVMAPYVADILSGLIACILSSLVLMLFDCYKDRIDTRNTLAKINFMQMQICGANICISALDEAKTSAIVFQTSSMVFDSLEEMSKNSADIQERLDTMKQKEEEFEARSKDTELKIKAAASKNEAVKDILLNIKSK